MAEKAFTMPTEAPTRVPFDARGFGGLTDRILLPEELRTLLLAAGTSHEARNSAWRELVIRARHDGPPRLPPG
ncbi:hypothetical protein [Streptomyces sp. V4I2]|uniref:hypothetical protein n=1 Tax=Streptomyces sp. V4I2 TaxID=3042280 RepID=UPI002789A085|nr:hypothetical protein [Streptomyces sp. V4I2]MDQ1049995.1 hypothetical protein [Streptomyces sp. V4I2]